MVWFHIANLSAGKFNEIMLRCLNHSFTVVCSHTWLAAESSTYQSALSKHTSRVFQITKDKRITNRPCIYQKGRLSSLRKIQHSFHRKDQVTLGKEHIVRNFSHISPSLAANIHLLWMSRDEARGNGYNLYHCRRFCQVKTQKSGRTSQADVCI